MHSSEAKLQRTAAVFSGRSVCSRTFGMSEFLRSDLCIKSTVPSVHNLVLCSPLPSATVTVAAILTAWRLLLLLLLLGWRCACVVDVT